MAFGMAIATLFFLPLVSSYLPLLMICDRPVRDEAGSLNHCSCEGQKDLVRCDLAATNEANLYDEQRQENEIDQGGQISSSQEGNWIYRLGMFFFLVGVKEICCHPYHDDGGVAVRATGVCEEETRFCGEVGSHSGDDEVLEILCG